MATTTSPQPGSAHPRAAMPVLAERLSGVGSSAIRDLLAVTRRPGMLSLAGGLPAPEGFPVRELRRLVNRRLRRDGPELLQYGPTEGDERLRHWIALDEGRRYDRPVPDAAVLITTGAQQAIDLVGRVLLDPRATVVMEAPGYLGAIQAFSLSQPRLVTVPVDDRGLQVDALARLLASGERPTVVYTVSSFQNPSGATLSGDRRRELAALAERYGFWIVDDDPYHELRFAGAPPIPIGALTDRVIRLGSFSKTVAPGLRVGWLSAPPELLAPLVRVKQAADLQASSLAQPILADFVADEAAWSRHLTRLRALYRSRAVALADALEGTFGDRLRFRRPDGGMFVWARFTDGTDTRRLLPLALDHGVAFVPGAEFHPTPEGHGPGAPVGAEPGSDWLRLSFATCSRPRLVEAVDRLHRAWQVDLARNPRP